MAKFLVIDNFIPQSYQDHLERIFYRQPNEIYEFNANSSGLTEKNKKLLQEAISEYTVKEGPQMVCVPLKNQNEIWNDVKPLSWFLELYTGITIRSIHRCKINLNPRNESWTKSIHVPHSDVGSYYDQNLDTKNDQYYSLIYYIKDSDGPTIIFDRTADEFFHLKKPLSIIGEVEPKKGRAILLKSDLLHAGTNPVESDSRIVANFVFSTSNLVDLDLIALANLTKDTSYL